MSKKQFEKSYNDRLFGSGLRKLIHESRYLWMQKILRNSKVSSVLELGCFDGKALEYFNVAPNHYEGYDANWEGGLDLAREKWKDQTNFLFFESSKLSEFAPQKKDYDAIICMETLEHLPDEDVESYVEIMGKRTKDLGLITVPNELGILVFFKILFKKLKGQDNESYSFSEIIFSTLGRTDKVKRNPGGHKGFNHKELLIKLERHVDLVKIQGLPFTWLGASLNPTVAITFRKKGS